MGLSFDHSFILKFDKVEDAQKLWDSLLASDNYSVNKNVDEDSTYRHQLYYDEYVWQAIERESEKQIRFSSGGYGYIQPFFINECIAAGVTPKYVMTSVWSCQCEPDEQYASVSEILKLQPYEEEPCFDYWPASDDAVSLELDLLCETLHTLSYTEVAEMVKKSNPDSELAYDMTDEMYQAGIKNMEYFLSKEPFS
jgi:hypothetical protein